MNFGLLPALTQVVWVSIAMGWDIWRLLEFPITVQENLSAWILNVSSLNCDDG